MKKTIVSALLTFVLFGALVASAQMKNNFLLNKGKNLRDRNSAPASTLTAAAPTQAPAASGAAKSQPISKSKVVESGGRSIEFNAATVEMVFKVYGDLVDKTVLKDPAVPAATITLQPKQGQELSDENKILAIETVLEMNGIHLEPYGEKFVRAVPRASARKVGIPLIMDSNAVLGETERVVSLMMSVEHIALDEAQKALEGLKSDKGVLNVFERSNSILITDTEVNIVRMREILRKIDIPTPVTENVFVRQVQNANAMDIQKVLQEIVEDAKKVLEKQGKLTQNQSPRPTPTPTGGGRTGLLGRANSGQQAVPQVNESLVTSVSDADRGMIRGESLIIADERSNKLIIKTQTSNMDFFDRVIEQLDVETTPDTVVKVYRLKYADSEDVSDMINDLIGNAPSSKNSSKGSQNANSKNAGNTKGNMTTGTKTTAKKSANQRTGEAKAGELSKENTTVLSDKRINGLVVMTQKELVPVVESIIEAMDIKLAQVLIETCIIEVNLEGSVKTGIDWVHQIPPQQDGRLQQAIAGGGGTTSLGSLKTLAEEGVKAAGVASTGGIGYYAFADKLNLGMIIQAAQSDSRSKYLASPVIMTVDNKEATIEATQMRYLLTGFTSSGTSYSTIAVPNYEQKEIGITIKTTPKINPNGTVMLEIEEEYSQLGAGQSIQTAGGLGTSGSGTNNTGLITVNVDTTVTRKLSADIFLENRQTVILGGLTETTTSQKETGIPILKDIPWIGRYLFGSTEDKETRKELLVFMTPYVLDDAAAAQVEALRRKQTLSDSRPWDDHGWSKSELADPVSAKERLRRQKSEWAAQDKEYEAAIEVEKAKGERAEVLKERAEEASERRAEEAKKLAEELNDAEQKKAEARAQSDLKKREANAALLKELQSETEAGGKATK